MKCLVYVTVNDHKTLFKSMHARISKTNVLSYMLPETKKSGCIIMDTDKLIER